MLYFCFLMGLLQEVPFSSFKTFFRRVSLMLYPDGFHFSALPTLLSWNAFTKRPVALSFTASRPPLSFFSFQEAFLPLLRVILSHFARSSYERDSHLPTSISISGSARLRVKAGLPRSWKDFALTYPLMLSPSSREILLVLLTLSRALSLLTIL